MKLKCKGCKKPLEVADPTGPTPGGVVTIECPHCHAATEVANPQGDEAFYLSEDTWLQPVFEKVEGARARDGSGPIRRSVLAGYELASDADEGARFFAKGSGIQRRHVPAKLLEEAKK